jgi:hypothetical protein
MPTPDWSEVKWYIYGTTVTTGNRPMTKYRVLARKLSPGECGPDFESEDVNIAGPKPIAVVVGCSLRTVLAHLKARVHPLDIPRKVAEAHNAQVERSKGDNHNWYRQWIADLERRKRACAASA